MAAVVRNLRMHVSAINSAAVRVHIGERPTATTSARDFEPRSLHQFLSHGFFASNSIQNKQENSAAANITGNRKGSSISNRTELKEEQEVHNLVRDELNEPEGGVKSGTTNAAHKIGDTVKDMGASVKDATDSDAAKKVGDVIENTGETIKGKTATKKTTLGDQGVVTS
jgi:hypothetical protein